MLRDYWQQYSVTRCNREACRVKINVEYTWGNYRKLRLGREAASRCRSPPFHHEIIVLNQH
jgi:hypothetical protein